MRLTRQQLREVDRLSIEQFAIPGIVLMENAARSALECAADMLNDVPLKRVLILCGGGNNGGDGLALARHLHNYLGSVQIGLCTDPEKYQNEALVNWKVVQAMRLPCRLADVPMIRNEKWDLIVDAILGTGLSQAPRDPFPVLAEAVNTCGDPVLAIDLPSGLDCDTGEPLGACIRATRTITFVAEKAGFASPNAKQYTGIIWVGSIGCPRELVRHIASI
jgi:NAD(P)H-hydrate epimerase